MNSDGLPRLAMATHVNAEFTADDLQDKAIQLNPNVGYCDLLNCAKQEVWGLSVDATIGFLSRAMITHCRILHGRVLWPLCARESRSFAMGSRGKH